MSTINFPCNVFGVYRVGNRVLTVLKRIGYHMYYLVDEGGSILCHALTMEPIETKMKELEDKENEYKIKAGDY